MDISYFPRNFSNTHSSEFKETLDIPTEIQVELTYKCNFNCRFCFNKNYVTERKTVLSTEEVLKIVKKVAESGIKKIRFTGGEPFMRRDIKQILSYAHSLGLFVMLNTNGYLVEPELIKNYVNDLLISFNSYDSKTEHEVTGVLNSFNKKIALIKSLISSTVNVRLCTVAIKENIETLERYYDLMNRLSCNQWFILRPISTPDNLYPINQKDVCVLIEKMLNLNEKYGFDVKIENAIPFCSYDKKKVAQVALGATNDDGHSKLVINTEGFVKPSYFMNVNLGHIFKDSILDCWRSEFISKMRSYGFLPKKCMSCEYKRICKGGSRFVSYLTTKRYDEDDYLSL